MPLHLNQLLAEGFHLSLKRFFPGVLFILHDERAACGRSGVGKHVSALSACLLNIIQLKGERFKGAASSEGMEGVKRFRASHWDRRRRNRFSSAAVMGEPPLRMM